MDAVNFSETSANYLIIYLPGGSEENHENLSKDRDRDLNPGTPKYEAGVLTTRPRCSGKIIYIYIADPGGRTE
jgi:hypothetical protein